MSETWYDSIRKQEKVRRVFANLPPTGSGRKIIPPATLVQIPHLRGKCNCPQGTHKKVLTISAAAKLLGVSESVIKKYQKVLEEECLA